jgi:hypothetical protein
MVTDVVFSPDHIHEGRQCPLLNADIIRVMLDDQLHTIDRQKKLTIDTGESGHFLNSPTGVLDKAF